MDGNPNRSVPGVPGLQSAQHNHSLQTQLVSRFRRASQFQASYTWSRAIADMTQEFGLDGLFDVAPRNRLASVPTEASAVNARLR